MTSLELDETGFEVVTPFYTHLNSKEEQCGILVNRGFVPSSHEDPSQYRTPAKREQITGILYKGDTEKQASLLNEPEKRVYRRVDLAAMAPQIQFANEADAESLMVKLVDFSEQQRSPIVPRVQRKEELLEWYVTPERHQAYANFWLSATGLILLANALVWVA